MPRAPTPHLCAEPGCPNIVEGAGRCPQHRRSGWDRATLDKSAYGHQWRKVRDAYIAQHPRCALCGKPAVEVHHIDHDPTNNAWSNLESLCREHHRGITGRRGAQVARSRRALA